MDNNLLLPTYKAPLSLKYKGIPLKVGLCLSRVTFHQLKGDPSSFLHPTEEAYFSSLSHPRRQHSYLLGRYCAKQAIIACDDDINLREIAIETGVFGHPVVTDIPRSHLQVSISHTDNFGAAISSPETHPMAIDVEAICPSKRDAIKTQLSLDEQKLWVSLRKGEGNEITQLTFLWTVKEALSKALKCGLTVPFEVLEIEVIKEKEGLLISSFKNFKQYQALSFCLGANICSIVYPSHTSFNVDLDSIQKSLREEPV